MSSNNPSTDTNVAVVALAVALAALIFTLGQLLGQYFATADGYRRCQPSVMGLWARLTRLRWRWSEFRFETLFTVPEITLRFDKFRDTGTIPNMSDTYEWVTGSNESRGRTLIDNIHFRSRRAELASWIPFLEALHQLEEQLERRGCYLERRRSNTHPDYGIDRPLVRPIVDFRERSWDFVPPEVVRPYAISNVSDIAVLARRMGMTWVDFRPHDGVLRAEGNGHAISSTYARSIGIILQYMYIGTPPLSFTNLPPSNLRSVLRPLDSELYTPSIGAAMMGFGILPGDAALGIPAFKVGTIGEVCATMDILDPSRRASQKIRDIRGIEPNVTFGFSDLISMASKMQRGRASTVVRLPVPTEYCGGLTCHIEGFVVFHQRLTEYLSGHTERASNQSKNILKQYENLKRKYVEWENEVLANEQVNDRGLAFLDNVHDCWDDATAYFRDIHKENPFMYYDLMAIHIKHAVGYWGDAWSNIREAKTRNHHGLRDWIAEGAHVYWDYLPRIVNDMREKGFNGDDSLVEEAWITMMFRAFCWWRCHSIGAGEDTAQDHSRLPSRYWNSKLPVYIG